MKDLNELYARIVVSLPWNDKIISIAERDRAAAFGFYAAACCFCQDNLTDGLIRTAELVKVFPDKRYDRLAKMLVEARLFEETDHGYLVHDYLDVNKSRAEVEAERKQKRDAGRAGGKAAAKARAKAAATADALAKSNPDTDTDTDTDTNPLNPPDEDAPKSVQRYLSLLRVYGHTVAIAPSEAVKRMIRAWGQIGYSDEAVEDALRIAIDNEARQPWEYANTVLLNRRTQPSAEDAYLEAKYGGAE